MNRKKKNVIGRFRVGIRMSDLLGQRDPPGAAQSGAPLQQELAGASGPFHVAYAKHTYGFGKLLLTDDILCEEAMIAALAKRDREGEIFAHDLREAARRQPMRIAGSARRGQET